MQRKIPPHPNPLLFGEDNLQGIIWELALSRGRGLGEGCFAMTHFHSNRKITTLLTSPSPFLMFFPYQQKYPSPHGFLIKN